MDELVYRLSFNTPAFLGDAQQQAQWRTPPIKALIRQWWRVVQKAQTPTDIERIRFDEGMLFGNAWLSDDEGKPLHRKSSLLIRLSDPTAGLLSNDGWQKLQFDDVQTSPSTHLRADLYTGYGPVQSERAATGGRRIVVRRAIDVGGTAKLRLGTKQPITGLDDALRLVHWFGTAGSRSRNGWGSLRLEPDNDVARARALGDALQLADRYARPWRDCLRLDWPHAIGRDIDGQGRARPLVWQSEELEHWRAAIGRLARIRVAVRLAAKRIRDSRSRAGAIHYLGYPAGTGEKNPWELPLRGRDAAEPRLASPLRFKVIRSGTRVRALIFHMPSRVPQAFLSAIGQGEADWLADDGNWLNAWSEVHRVLDEARDPMVDGRSLGLKRLGASA